MCCADSVTNREKKKDEDARPKEQPKDDEDGPEAPEERTDKSPKLEVGMNAKIFNARPEMAPRSRTAH